VLEIVDVLENDARYENLSPFGEPQLGKRGVYPTMGGQQATDAVMAMLWLLAYSDGSASLLDIASIAGADFANQVRLADILLAFARRLPAVLAELDDAVVESDHSRVDRLAHGLKGSAGTLGAHRLAGACARLEAYAQKRDVAGEAVALRDLHDRADVAGRAVTTVSQELVARAA
jgi:HPt (histidine-containing phosphotransfer) domain-containing protein